MANDSGLGGLFDFSFESFVTPVVVKVLYIIVIIFSALAWLVWLLAGIRGGFFTFVTALIFGTLAAVVIVLLYRVMLELVMVIFRISENTERMADALENQG